MSKASRSESDGDTPRAEPATTDRGNPKSRLRQEDVRDVETYVRYAFERKGKSCALGRIPEDGGFQGELTGELTRIVEGLSKQDASGAVAAQILFAGWQHKHRSPAWPWFKNLFRQCVRSCPALSGLESAIVDGPISAESIEACFDAAFALVEGVDGSAVNAVRVNRIASIVVWLASVNAIPIPRLIERLSERCWEPESDCATADAEILRAVLGLGPQAGHVATAFRELADSARREASAERLRATQLEEARLEATTRLSNESAALDAARGAIAVRDEKLRTLEEQLLASKDKAGDDLRQMRAGFMKAASEWLEMLGVGLAAYNKDRSNEEFVSILADHARRVEVRVASHLEMLRSGGR